MISLILNFGVPFNISATSEASDFKFGMQLGFAKAHHKITPRGESGRGPELGELPKILGSPFNMYATAEASKFKFGMQLVDDIEFPMVILAYFFLVAL